MGSGSRSGFPESSDAPGFVDSDPGAGSVSAAACADAIETGASEKCMKIVKTKIITRKAYMDGSFVGSCAAQAGQQVSPRAP